MARKGDQAVEPALGAAESRKPRGRPAAREEAAKLLLDEGRQPLTVAEPRRLCPESLEVVAYDLVEHARPGLSRFIGRRREGHAPGESRARTA